MRSGDAVARVNEASSADERVATSGSTHFELDVPRPRVGLGLHSADYSEVDVRLNGGDAALAAVFTLRAVLVVVVFE